jgi:hypothetical protein
MTAAILSILAALVPLAILLVRRRVVKKDDLYTQHQKRANEADKHIANRDGVALALDIDTALSWVRAHSKDSSSGPGSDTHKGSSEL